MADFHKSRDDMAKEKSQLPPGVVKTAREVAAAFGVKTRTVKTWRSDGMPVNDDMTYNLAEIAAWKTARDIEQGRTGDKGENDERANELAKVLLEYQRENAKWKKVQAEMGKLKLDRERGELLPRAEVEAGRIRRIAVVKQNFLRLPQHVAATLAAISDPVEVRKVLERQIRGIIGQFEEGGDGRE